MSTIVVEVMPKAELLDPQGKAVAGALARMGKSHLERSPGRQKRFEITADGTRGDEALFAEVAELAQTMLSNTGDRRRRQYLHDGRGASAIPIPPVPASPARPTDADRRRHLPGSLDDRDASAPCGWPGPTGRALARRPRPARRGCGRAARRLHYGDYLRAARSRLSPIMSEVSTRRTADAGARHLQRLPGARPRRTCCRAASSAMTRLLRLPRPTAAGGERRTAWTSGFSRRGDHHSAEERRGRLHRRTRRRSHGSRARAGSPSATSASTRTAQSTTSPGSPTRVATSSG